MVQTQSLDAYLCLISKTNLFVQTFGRVNHFHIKIHFTNLNHLPRIFQHLSLNTFTQFCLFFHLSVENSRTNRVWRSCEVIKRCLTQGARSLGVIIKDFVTKLNLFTFNPEHLHLKYGMNQAHYYLFRLQNHSGSCLFLSSTIGFKSALLDLICSILNHLLLWIDLILPFALKY